MKTLLLSAFAALTLTLTALTANAQNAVLTDLYGRGVHAYYAGDLDQAYELLTMAIDNDIQDPRAYYFRGIVHHASGRMEEAKSDWQEGAELEAQGEINASIGRSLSRFQGAARLELEQIRQRAKLEAMADAQKRSEQRYGEIGATPGGSSAAPAQPTPTQPQPTQPAPTPPTTAQPAPATGGDAAGGDAAENPFADDLADGEPQVAADDALEGAMENPFAGEADDAAAPAAPAGDNNPFGGGGDDAGNPFGGGNDGGNPFGGGADDGGAGNPFGGQTGGMGGADDNPFGGDGGGGDDANPFGDNPF